MNPDFHYLIIDDDNSNNLICKYTIQRFAKKAVINIFNKPEAALDFLKDTEFTARPGVTVMFLDVNMPVMTGFEFLREFMKFPEETKRKLRIYILTSSIEDFTTRAVAFPIVRRFLSKPLKIPYLEQIEKDII